MNDSIHRIPIPNPFFEGRNSVYVLRCDPVTLIDTGVATEKAYQHLVAGLRAMDLVVSDVQRVILTHKHIDHIGNAWRIQQESGAEVLIHESECKSLTDVDPSGKRFADLVRQHLATWGIPAAAAPNSESNSMPAWQLESCEPTGLEHGQRLPVGNTMLEVIHTPGHTKGSICLRLDDALFSGDHVLEELSPNVGAGDLRSRGLLRQYMNSLAHVRDLPISHTHPGHGPTFRGPAPRCRELLAHHEQRLTAIESILRLGEATVYDVAKALFGDMHDFHLVLGCAEANAHLELLLERGTVVVEEGVYRSPV